MMKKAIFFTTAGAVTIINQDTIKESLQEFVDKIPSLFTSVKEKAQQLVSDQDSSTQDIKLAQ